MINYILVYYDCILYIYVVIYWNLNKNNFYMKKPLIWLIINNVIIHLFYYIDMDIYWKLYKKIKESNLSENQ